MPAKKAKISRFFLIANILILAGILFSCTDSSTMGDREDMIFVEDENYPYSYVKDDPMNTRIYTLKNGLKVYLSRVTTQPKIATAIAVRTGSKNDPADNTGLSHYLEHIMFKGTSRLGTSDFGKEKEYLDKIEALFEAHKQEEDSLEMKRIYAQIDSISYEASKISIANEYDMAMNMMGASGLNAFTSNDQTVYISDIPSNELSRWAAIESERFGSIIPRLFHTELETVYEEKNRTFDNDNRRVSEATMALLFPGHTYGTQTTIGKAEHLKKPSITAIKKHFDTYYVPNNMAVCLAGDLNYEEAIKLMDENFGKMEPKEIIEDTKNPILASFSSPRDTTVVGPEPAYVQISYRFPIKNYADRIALELMDNMLNNGDAGLIDLNLLQKQKVLQAWSYSRDMDGYGMLSLGGRPREGQSLKEVEDLLVAQVDSIKKGQFPSWLPEAVTNNQEIGFLQELQYQSVLKYRLAQLFVYDIDYNSFVSRFDTMSSFDPTKITAWANEKLDQTYVTVYKEQGDMIDIPQIKKPRITPVELNRDMHSKFFDSLSKMEVPEQKPIFVDINKQITSLPFADSVEFLYTPNEENDLFSLAFRYKADPSGDPWLKVAVEYLNFCGTTELSPEEFKQELYKLGTNFGVYTGTNGVYVYVSGLDKNLKPSMELMLDIMSSPRGSVESFNAYVDDLLKKRANNKENKYQILTALNYYAKYGPKNPFNNVVPESELREAGYQKMEEILTSIPNKYAHYITYYGPSKGEKVSQQLKDRYTPGKDLKSYYVTDLFKEREKDDEKVLYAADFEMVQAFVRLIDKRGETDVELLPKVEMFNEYFSGSMSAEVFTEIREKRALAYSANASLQAGDKAGRPAYMTAFLGTQADKLVEAVDAMTNLFRDAKVKPDKFEEVKNSYLSQQAGQRYFGGSLFSLYLNGKDYNYDGNLRQKKYEAIKSMTAEDLQKFKDEVMDNNNFDVLVVGDKDKLPLASVKNIDRMELLSKDLLFGY